MKVSRVKVSLILLAVLVLAAALYVVYFFNSFKSTPMLLADKPVIIQIKPNSTASSLANLLFQQGLIKSKQLFLLTLKLKGNAHRIKAGVYEIPPGQNLEQFIDRIISGDVLIQSFKIIDGSNLAQVIYNLQQAPYLHYNESDWDAIKEPYPTAEGLLLADTYNYDAGSDAKRLLKKANAYLMQCLHDNWQSRNKELPYKTEYDLLIAASILEKETSIPAERETIAGVIVNRLNKKMPLQMDPTVIYALGSAYSGKLHHQDMSIDSPYNTYKYKGLPPTPIAMVGKNAIYAAAHPQVSNYLYFVAKGDGSHIFSETYSDQLRAISQYLGKN